MGKNLRLKRLKTKIKKIVTNLVDIYMQNRQLYFSVTFNIILLIRESYFKDQFPWEQLVGYISGFFN